jgi:SAM-dependent methyltransferase
MTRPAALYDWPKAYDIAFNWDPAGELAMLERAIADHAHRPEATRRILEPGCGTGRLLIPLALAGYQALGYDHSPAMIAYAKQRIAQSGLDDRLRVIVADMTTAAFDRVFDAAACPISSLSHLRDEAAIVDHFRVTGRSLRPGGVYLIQLATVWEPGLGHEPSFWTTQRDGVRITVRWTVEADDPDARLSHQRYTMTVDDHGERHERTETLAMRLWLDADVRRLVHASGALELVGAYDEAGEPLAIDEPITAAAGNAWWVCRARQRPIDASRP